MPEIIDSKILFLDIDGVLNNDFTKERTPSYYENAGWGMEKRRYTGIEQEKVDLLLRIIRETGAWVVLSSTWRKADYMHSYMWGALGKEVKSRYIGDTPVLDYSHRGKEIYDHLQIHPYKNFIILDDDLNVGEYFQNEWIKTEPIREGLTTELVDKAIKLLNSKE